MSMPHSRSRRWLEKQKFNSRRNYCERVTIRPELSKNFEISRNQRHNEEKNYKTDVRMKKLRRGKFYEQGTSFLVFT